MYLVFQPVDQIKRGGGMDFQKATIGEPFENAKHFFAMGYTLVECKIVNIIHRRSCFYFRNAYA